MNQNKLSFESENLAIDYISFNIPGSGNTESIAKYLFKTFNFNSTFTKGKNGTSKSWFYLKKNQHQFSFRQLEYDPASKSFWEGTTIHFSGNNAAHFYKIVQAQKFVKGTARTHKIDANNPDFVIKNVFDCLKYIDSA